MKCSTSNPTLLAIILGVSLSLVIYLQSESLKVSTGVQGLGFRVENL
jgi:hypothetical protein